MCVLFSWVLLSGQFCAQWFMLWQTAHFVGIPYISGISAMGVCRTFWCWWPVLIYSIWVGRFTIWIDIFVDCELSNVSVATVQIFFLQVYKVWYHSFPSCFTLFYKDFFLIWTNSFIVKVVLCMLCWLLLDVKLFKVCSGDFTLFRKCFDQLGFNKVVTWW